MPRHPTTQTGVMSYLALRHQDAVPNDDQRHASVGMHSEASLASQQKLQTSSRRHNRLSLRTAGGDNKSKRYHRGEQICVFHARLDYESGLFS
jgi:hypothetical protein